MFVLECIDAEGRSVPLHYDPRVSTLTHADGSPVLAGQAEAVDPTAWPEDARIRPERPGRKHARPSVLKIQLGLACNYACSYCNQSSQIESMAASGTADATAFLANLDRWLEGAPDRIELWGGEPLLYFRKLQRLVPELDRRFPGAELSMVTNGSLLTPEIVDFIATYDIRITVSHDGPGQHLRGADPFDDPACNAMLRALWVERHARRRIVFSAVLTPDNCDPAAIRRWFVERLGDESVVTYFEGIVATHDDRTLDGAGTWTDAQYARLREAVARAFEGGDALQLPALTERARGFVQTLLQGLPASALGQKCGMDRSDHLAVDLLGNVLTCQNTGAQGRHGIGRVTAMDRVRLDTATHWSHREHCSHCPVLHLCGGSCMYLEGEQFAQSCENEYQFGLGLLDGVLRRAWGLRLVEVRGDVRRPLRRKTIRLRAAGRAPRR